MTQRIKGYVVTLEDDVREDDAEFILNAIRMIKRVASVEPVPSSIDDHMNRRRLRYDLLQKTRELWNAILKGD